MQNRSELKSEGPSPWPIAINGGLAEEDYLRSLEQDKISPIRIHQDRRRTAPSAYDNEAAPAQMEKPCRANTEVADALR